MTRKRFWLTLAAHLRERCGLGSGVTLKRYSIFS